MSQLNARESYDDDTGATTTMAVPEQAVIHQDLEAGSQAASNDEGSYMWHRIIFMITGCYELLFWNNVLAILYDIRKNVYPDYPSMTDSITAINTLANVSVAIYCVSTGAMHQKAIILGGSGIAIMGLLLALVVQCFSGLTGVIVVHLVSFAAGLCVGLFQTGNYGLASSMKKNMAGYVSTGEGICGVFSYLMWMGISNTKLSTKSSLWILMAISFVFGVISVGSYIMLLRKPDVAKRVEQTQAKLRAEATDPDAPTYMFLFKQCWTHVCSMWVNFFITLVIFPSIGPLDWDEGDFSNYVTGAFQFGDLTGRYTPNVLKFLTLNTIGVFTILGFRLCFIPLGLLIWYYKKNSFWGNHAFHMIYMATLAVTNGWTCSSIFINTPKVIKTEAWRSRVSSMLVVAVLTGITVGLWTARIFTACTN